MSQDVFESINLAASGIRSDEPYEAIHKSRPYNNLPLSIPEYSDDDINPAELILSESSNERGESKAPEIPDHEFFSNPSRISAAESSASGSKIFTTPKYDRNLDSSETPLQFLTNKNKILLKELQHNITLHDQCLSNGDPRLNRLRSMIAQNFEQLSEGYYSVNEIYTREIDYNETLFAQFEKWDQKRNHILDKIRTIKSPSNKHGTKLAGLLDRSADIDSEISSLEERLKNLRIQKQLINSEIENTSSVLESRTSKYVERFKEIESQGKQAILDFLYSNGVPPQEIEAAIRSTPVDVTFMNGYSKLADKSQDGKQSGMVNTSGRGSPNITTPSATSKSNSPLAKSESPIAPVASTDIPLTKSIMGVQPFVLPENSSNSEGPSSTPPTKDLKDRELWNHGYGPSAYERGYERGTESSLQVKERLAKLVQKIIKSIPEKEIRQPLRSSVTVDDHANTIKEKLDLDPIIDLLEHRVSALSDLVQSSSANAASHHEFGIIWKDIVHKLNIQEGKLSDYVAESTPSLGLIDPQISQILNDTLSFIKLRVQSLHHSFPDSKSIRNSPLSRTLGNEVMAILSALSIMSRDERYDKLSKEFEELGLVVADSKSDSNGTGRTNRVSKAYEKADFLRTSQPTTSTTNLHYLSSDSSSIASDLGEDAKSLTYDRSFKKK